MVGTLALNPALSPGRGGIVRRFFGMSCAGVGRRVTEQSENGRWRLLLLGEKAGMREVVKHLESIRKPGRQEKIPIHGFMDSLSQVGGTGVA
jgi:hypothetical protein